METSLVQDALIPVVVFLTPIIVRAIKSLADRYIPNWLLPALAGIVGPGIDQLYALLANVQATGWAAIALGLAGVGLREIKKQGLKLASGQS